MTSYIVVATDKKKRQEYLEEFRQKQNIDKYDLTLISQEDSKNKQSIGIEEIKSLRSKVFLKPIKSKIKAVVLEDAHLLTIEAQNALLKLLEEPPDHTNIILSIETLEPILPTIISRCRIILLTKETVKLSDENKKEFKDFISSLPEMKIGDRLKLAEDLAKDKEEAIAWIEKLILILREQVLEKISNEKNATMNQWNNEAIRSFQALHVILKTTNVNPRFAIENTLLSL